MEIDVGNTNFDLLLLCFILHSVAGLHGSFVFVVMNIFTHIQPYTWTF